MNSPKLVISEVKAELLALFYSLKTGSECNIYFHSIDKKGYWNFKITRWNDGKDEELYKNY